MNKSDLIAARLLEADPDDFAPQDYVKKLWASEETGEVDFHTAKTARVFYHRTKRYRSSDAPIQVRRNGKTKTWVRQPGKFQVPVKYGLYDYFYIDNDNAHEWSTKPLNK